MQYGLKNILRFYDTADKQNRNLLYVGGNIKTWRNLTDIYHVPSFQIQVTNAVTAASDVVVNLVTLSTLASVDISNKFTTAGATTDDLYIADFTSYNYLIYNRNKNLNTNLAQGMYYLHIYDGVRNYYSEPFCVTSLSGSIIVTYNDTDDIDSIDYSNGDYSQFQNKLIVDTKLQRPDWVIEEEGTEDGETNFLPTLQTLKKKHKFIFYAPEYILDSIMMIEFHDTVTVVTDYSLSTSETITVQANTFKTAYEWTDTKGFAKVTCEFETAPVIKTNCANNVT